MKKSGTGQKRLASYMNPTSTMRHWIIKSSHRNVMRYSNVSSSLSKQNVFSKAIRRFMHFLQTTRRQKNFLFLTRMYWPAFLKALWNTKYFLTASGIGPSFAKQSWHTMTSTFVVIVTMTSHIWKSCNVTMRCIITRWLFPSLRPVFTFDGASKTFPC